MQLDSSFSDSVLPLSAGLSSKAGFFPYSFVQKASVCVITILIALMVPAMGGILEVVISLGAVTGGALFLPPIWSLFSKKQTGRTLLTTTFITLSINILFKFITPLLFDFSLSRAAEMTLGVVLPMLILLFFEVKLTLRPQPNPHYESYIRDKSVAIKKSDTEIDAENAENHRGNKILGLGIFFSGLLMLLIGFLSSVGQGLLLGIALLVMITGGLIVAKGIINKRKA